jgi:hypothetical protein
MNQDLEHLRLLSIFHYVVGGITALFACIPIIHLVVGASMIAGFKGAEEVPVPLGLIGVIFVIIAGALILAGWSLAVCQFLTGSRLSNRTNYTFCFVVAGVECILVPFGTALGVFTIIVLSRPTVKELFGHPPGSAERVEALS